MSKASSPTSPEPGHLHSGIPPLAVVVATNLSNAHTTVQYLAGLAALAFALTHDILVHRR